MRARLTHSFRWAFFSILGHSPLYSPKPVEVKDVFTQALIPGLVHPSSKLQGFAYFYFKRIPDQVDHLTFEISYKVQGEKERYQFSFPLVLR
jgi:hypothetical protein